MGTNSVGVYETYALLNFHGIDDISDVTCKNFITITNHINEERGESFLVYLTMLLCSCAHILQA